MYKIKYPIASWGLCPPDPLLQRYNSWVSPSSQQILYLPLPENAPEKSNQKSNLKVSKIQKFLRRHASRS